LSRVQASQGRGRGYRLSMPAAVAKWPEGILRISKTETTTYKELSPADKWATDLVLAFASIDDEDGSGMRGLL
jgi:hypothetical protein